MLESGEEDSTSERFSVKWWLNLGCYFCREQCGVSEWSVSVEGGHCLGKLHWNVQHALASWGIRLENL